MDLLAAYYATLGTVGPPAYAQRFITAAGIADATQIAALYALETALLDAGALSAESPAASKMLAFYPFVGGTATRHRLNFIDPTSYPLSFVNSVSHSATGVYFQGGYAATGIIPSQVLPGDASGQGLYLRQGGGDYFVGSRLGGNFFTMGDTGGAFIYGVHSQVNYLATTGKGGFRAVGNSPGNFRHTVIDQQVTSSGNLAYNDPTSLELILGGMNNEGSFGFFAGIEVAGYYVAHGALEPDNLLAIGSALTSFNTRLNRAV